MTHAECGRAMKLAVAYAAARDVTMDIECSDGIMIRARAVDRHTRMVYDSSNAWTYEALWDLYSLDSFLWALKNIIDRVLRARNRARVPW